MKNLPIYQKIKEFLEKLSDPKLILMLVLHILWVGGLPVAFIVFVALCAIALFGGILL